jgi:nicotinamide-nucleotide adenylyltransferase
MSKALFIGRFQPFHKGHLEAVKQILKQHSLIYIGIGGTSGLNNPFTIEERAEMIKNAMKAEKIKNYKIIAIHDTGNDIAWIKELNSLCPDFDVAYTGNKWTAGCIKKMGKKVKKMKRYFGLHATGIRKKIKENKNWEKYVPKAVAKYLKKIKAEKRLLD